MKNNYLPAFKLLFVLLFPLLTAFRGSAQYVTIPDPAFATWLNTHYPSCMNGNQMDTTCVDIISDTVINVTGTFANLDGIQYFDSVTVFFCTNANVSVIPAFPPHAREIHCSMNALTSLPPLPATLKYLECSGNDLSGLPPLPAGMMDLRCGYNPITALPALPSGLEILNCSAIAVPSLPALPSSLVHLFCLDNSLVSLPTLPASLQTLYCDYNSLSTLPSLPAGLLALNCSFNQLTQLPDLPPMLYQLYCTDNLLSSLPNLPASIMEVQCQNNQLTALPAWPPNLNYFYCNNNLIHCFETLPDTPFGIQVDGNPVTCLPNYISVMTPWMLSLPLCSENDPIANPFDCPAVNGISGTVYLDGSGNCQMDTGEQPAAGVPVRLLTAGGDFLAISYTNPAGNYYFPNFNGTYRVVVDTTDAPFIMNCDTDSLVTLGTTIAEAVSFGVSCSPAPDLGITLATPVGILFPGQPHSIQVHAGALLQSYFDCAQVTGGTVTVTVNGPTAYLNPHAGYLAPTLVNGNTATYDIPDFSAIQNDFILLDYMLDTTAQAGDIICIQAAITLHADDPDPFNNQLESCFVVSNSYDPNYKAAWPYLVPNAYDDPITYTIHFQNTGTAPAINIRLVDTLDPNLDLTSFELLGSSHPVITSLNGNLLTFRFNDIYLADSTSNEPASHGFAQYRIRPYSGLPLGTVIENTAYIYFDFNAPVVTNTATTTFDVSASLPDQQQNEPIVFPNPVTDQLHISFPEQYETLKICIADINGRAIRTHLFASGEPVTLPVSGLSDGYYLLHVQCDEAVKPIVIPFIKE